jgi:(p)ppGpp synthase/HD superfamily hydrolase
LVVFRGFSFFALNGAFADNESTHLKVQRAIEYAREAHAGQFRRTGEPYITHCIETAKILAALIPPQQGKRVFSQH